MTHKDTVETTYEYGNSTANYGQIIKETTVTTYEVDEDDDLDLDFTEWEYTPGWDDPVTDEEAKTDPIALAEQLEDFYWRNSYIINFHPSELDQIIKALKRG